MSGQKSGSVYPFFSTLEKYQEAVHGDDVLYCHYFNNNKDCPFDDQCIFLHEESAKCKFDGVCERKLCMYKHDMKEEENEDDAESDNEDDGALENICVEDIRPVLEKFKKTVENFEVILQKCSVKCKQCDFEAKDSNGLNMHVKAKHQNENKSQ